MIQPVPTPISNTFPLDCLDKKAMIFSTNSSVSGLGIKVSGLTINSRP